ncbi:MAG TPA: hypothetical protein PKK15_06985 [Kouleothrix sp.]|nr:hypothetical protein [Kouleothrix sp.]
MITTPRNLKTLLIEPSFLIDLFTHDGSWRIRTGLPADANVVDCGYDPMRRSFYLTLEHPSFEPIPPGQVIPTVFEMEIEVIQPPPPEMRAVACDDQVHFMYGDQHAPARILNPAYSLGDGAPDAQKLAVSLPDGATFTTVATIDTHCSPATWHYPTEACDAHMEYVPPPEAVVAPVGDLDHGTKNTLPTQRQLILCYGDLIVAVFNDPDTPTIDAVMGCFDRGEAYRCDQHAWLIAGVSLARTAPPFGHVKISIAELEAIREH